VILNVVIALPVESLIVFDSFYLQNLDFLSTFNGVISNFSASHLESVVDQDVTEREEEDHEVGGDLAVGVRKFSVQVGRGML